jgi:hypothetical protein
VVLVRDATPSDEDDEIGNATTADIAFNINATAANLGWTLA